MEVERLVDRYVAPVHTVSELTRSSTATIISLSSENFQPRTPLPCKNEKVTGCQVSRASDSKLA